MEEEHMSEKRKDNKGRVLKIGEQQRKDGRYIYTYKGKDGKIADFSRRIDIFEIKYQLCEILD